MKLPLNLIRFTFLILALGFHQNVVAQEDTTRLKFSEEIVKEPENKNMKWVRLRPHQYNMDKVSSMFKIGVAPLYSQVSIEVLTLAYEKKIPRSQWSVELKLSGDLNIGDHGYYSYLRSTSTETGLASIREVREYAAMHLSVRHYLVKNRKMLKEKSGDNLWGFYGIARLISPVSWRKEIETTYDQNRGYNVPERIIERRGLTSRLGNIGLGVEYQQRFLKKGFADISIGYAKQFVRERYNSSDAFLDVTIGYSIFKLK